MLHYLLQTLIFQALFLALYDAFHKKDTFFNWNRVYLIITPILSLVFPFIKIEAFNTQTSQVYFTKLERVITISSDNLVVLNTTSPDQNPINWWLIIYYTGAGISLFLLILKFYKLNIMKTFSYKTNIKNKKIVTLPNSTQAFSFWNTIYLGDGLNEEEKKQILVHEIVHVDQKHSLDQLYFEFLKIFLWWNPLIYINQSRITVLHEYIADAVVISAVGKRNYIEQLLNATFQTQEITFVNQFFNQSLIKKRIVMLQKSKSKAIAKFKYLLLIPVITGILGYTSSSTESNQSANNNIESPSSNENVDISKLTKNREPKCPNKYSLYDKKLDNYLSVRNGKKSEAIVEIVSVESSKKVRIAYLENNTTQFIRNIPEGQYKLHVSYGEDYAEKIVDGTCKAYFKKEIATEVNNNILNFNTVKTKEGIDIPSFDLKLDLLDKSSNNDNENEVPTNSVSLDAEPKCLNKNSEYDNKIDNFIRINVGKSADAIVKMISQENSKSIRTVHIKRNQVYFVRNIPEGKYKLHVAYGDNYVEKTVDGTCKGYFKNEKATEIDKNILDYTVIKTKKGVNVPSYNITLDMNE